MSNEQTAKARPTHRIYAVSKQGDEKTRWTELGAAWPHKDGKGFQLKFNASPFGECEVVLRAISPKVAKPAAKSSRRTTGRHDELNAANGSAQ